MNQQVKLSAELAKWDWLKEKLGAEDFDAVTLIEIIQSETDIEECLLEIAESAIEDEHSITAIKARMHELQERASRLQNRADKKRRIVSATMQNLQIKNVTGPNATISLRAGGRELVIMDEKQIPPEYFVPQPPKLDRRLLKESLESGPVAGAQLGNGGVSATIRVK